MIESEAALHHTRTEIIHQPRQSYDDHMTINLQLIRIRVVMAESNLFWQDAATPEIKAHASRYQGGFSMLVL
jgi:hypothetical protein